MTRYLRRLREREREEYDPLDPAKQHTPKSVKDVVGSYVDTKLHTGVSRTMKAYNKWCEIAGSRAVKHTKAVWISEEKENTLPDLVVYIDNSSLLSDYTTDAELFLDRLNYAGFPVNSLKFSLSNKIEIKKEDEEQVTPVNQLPELSDYELFYIEDLCSKLPENLREKASKTIQLSYRRMKVEDSGNY